ncbi:MAG TPA: hypothetical protein PLU50_04065 [Pseudobdellovibrionaceae bacterium]|nr:hypothetical protein [Pseudobdellovibrionaceae bacterium]
MKKTITLTALLISGTGFASTKADDVAQRQKQVYQELRAKLSESGLTPEQSIEVIEVLGNEIEGKPNWVNSLDPQTGGIVDNSK